MNRPIIYVSVVNVGVNSFINPLFINDYKSIRKKINLILYFFYNRMCSYVVICEMRSETFRIE